MNPNLQANQQRNQQQQQQQQPYQQQQHHQQNQIENYSQNGENQYSEQEENEDIQAEQVEQDQREFIPFNAGDPPLSDQQLKDQISQFFNIYINPPLIFSFLTAISFENSQIIYINQMTQSVFTHSSLIFYFAISLCYIYQFFKTLRSSTVNWKSIRLLNQLGFFSILILMIIYIFNCMMLQRYFDLRWSRMTITLLLLFQYTYITIIKFYKEFENTLSAYFNRIYYLITPLSDHDKENTFGSLTEIYIKLKQTCFPLTFIYFLIQIIYHMKMYKWAPPFLQQSIPSLDQEYGHEQYLWIAIDQQRTLHMFSLLLIFAMLILSCYVHFGIPHEHQSRLVYILIFIHYTTYIMTYKIYLTGQFLADDHTNLQKILTPIFLITFVPLFCSIFIKRALTKLYRLPLNEQQQLQQHQLELFSQYKLDYSRNYANLPEYASQIYQQQTQMYQMVSTQQFAIAAVLFIYQFVNINQLYSEKQQFGIGLQIQGFYDFISDMTIYIFLIHTIIYQILIQTSENILNQSEYGIFSFLFIANYILTLSWALIGFITLIIITSYIMNFTEQQTDFHIGPALSILWMLLVHSIKQAVVQKLIYEYSSFVKKLFQQQQQQQQQIIPGIDIIQAIFQEINHNNLQNQQQIYNGNQQNFDVLNNNNNINNFNQYIINSMNNNNNVNNNNNHIVNQNNIIHINSNMPQNQIIS